MRRIGLIRMRNRSIALIIIILLIIANFVLTVYGDDWYSNKSKYVRIYNKKSGEELFCTAWGVNKGDMYHSSDNKLYEVTEIINNEKANAIFVKDVQMPDVTNYIDNKQVVYNPQENEMLVGLYFTHTDESYIPTSGTSSKDANGDILIVGEDFKNKLEKRRIDVIIDKTIHDPHDIAAYRRSRRTALSILKNSPDIIFDIHRDGIPREQYITKINNEVISQVRIVLGKRNPNLGTNEELAQTIKAISDEKYSGLIKDIYYGKGNYNQDLYPQSLLLELGTYTNSIEEVMASTEYFADIISMGFYGTADNGMMIDDFQTTKSGIKEIAITVSILALLIVGYFYYSSNKG